ARLHHQVGGGIDALLDALGGRAAALEAHLHFPQARFARGKVGGHCRPAGEHHQHKGRSNPSHVSPPVRSPAMGIASLHPSYRSTPQLLSFDAMISAQNTLYFDCGEYTAAIPRRLAPALSMLARCGGESRQPENASAKV